MSDDLDRFGKKNAGWLEEHGFRPVPRGWAESTADEDFYGWTVFRKLGAFEVRLQQDAYDEDVWTGWPVFDGAFNDFIRHEALRAEHCRSAEDAFKEVILKVKGFAAAVPERQGLLRSCEVEG